MTQLPEQQPALATRYAAVRARTVALCAPLTIEDQLVQPMADASPSKWHLAHTTWFFELFVLERTGADAFDPAFGYLFNSYYEAVGARVARPRHARAHGLVVAVEQVAERGIERVGAGALEDE